MPVIKNVKRRFYSKDNVGGGMFEHEHQCKVFLDTDNGKCSFVLPQHIFDVFERHNINSNSYFRNQMEMKWSKKGEPIVEFDEITMFEPSIEIINQCYKKLRKEEVIKKVIVVDAHLALSLRFNEPTVDGLERSFHDMAFSPFKNHNGAMNHAIHFGYRVGYQVGINIYSTPDYETQVHPDPLITSTRPVRKEDETEVVIDWTQEREDLLRLIADNMKKLILQIQQFRDNISDPDMLEMIDKKQIGVGQLMLAQTRRN